MLFRGLDERWDEEYTKYANCNVPVRDSEGNELRQTHSSFYLNLVSKPWVPAMGKHTGTADKSSRSFVPKELFLYTEEVSRLLHKHVRYTDWTVRSNNFKEALGFKSSVNLDTLMEELKTWATSSGGRSGESLCNEFTTSLAHMKEVYSFLYKRCTQSQDEKKRICEAFQNKPLVFVPHTKMHSSPSEQEDVRGCFCFKKEVCWCDPSGVAMKLCQKGENPFQRQMLQQFYSQADLSMFLKSFLKVDKTPNMDEYVEMASSLAEGSKFPTPTSIKDILRIFAVLGEKCIAHGPNQGVPYEYETDELGVFHPDQEVEIDPVKSSYLKTRLENEEILPTAEKWVALSVKPMLADDKNLQNIFQKEKNVYFLDVEAAVLKKTSQRSRKPNHEDVKHQELVNIFWKACGISKLSDCIEKRFVPDLVQMHCIPTQKHFHTTVPCIQRFLYSELPEIYDEVKAKEIPQKLKTMQFATVKHLDTVYSLKMRPEANVPVEKKFGLEVLGSTFCLYAVEQHVNNTDEINAEIVNLFTSGRRECARAVRNFLSALCGFQGTDLEKFLRENQDLDELPGSEELWDIPAPEEPERVSAPEEEIPEPVPRRSQQKHHEDGELHCWPPKSSALAQRSDAPVNPTPNDILKMWPPPAPPESVKDVLPKGGIASQGTRSLEQEQRPSDQIRRDKEADIQNCLSKSGLEPATNRPTAAGVDHGEVPATASPLVGGLVPSTSPPALVKHSHQDNAVAPHRDAGGETNARDLTNESKPATLPSASASHESVNMAVSTARPKHSAFSLFVYTGEDTRQEFEELPLGGEPNLPEHISLVENPNKEEIGRWGELFVLTYLENQQKKSPSGLEIQLRWMNEHGNSNAPYDFEIIRQVPDEENEGETRTIITYIEVKTTSSDQKEAFEISAGELTFAFEKREALHLYRVFNAGKPGHVRLARLQNLAANLEKKTVKLCMVI